MPDTVTKDPLLQPITIKHLTIRNRIMSTSHACGLHDDGMPAEQYQAYHEEKAKGVSAFPCSAGHPTSPRTAPTPFNN